MVGETVPVKNTGIRLFFPHLQNFTAYITSDAKNYQDVQICVCAGKLPNIPLH